jgi:hypothetical protein
VSPGDYFCSQRSLYCVEAVGDQSVLVEDCRSGALIDIALDELLDLERVPRRAGPDGGDALMQRRRADIERAR